MTTQTEKLDRLADGELARAFAGELVRQGDPTYEVHRRVWNGSIDRFPELIARCASVDDVIAAVRFARGTDLAVAVRGGGHSFPGLSVCDGGIVIDLGPMRRIDVDPQARTVRAQAGVLLGELDQATQAHGLAVPIGAVTHTGIAGLTLGGGIGWLMRKYGLTVDQLLSVDLVTADGECVTASATENTDLFWGVRGGGGNFGIVTEFEFRLNPVGPMVFSGLVLWRVEEGDDVARFYREWCADGPDDLMTALALRRAPHADFVPAELRGSRVIAVVGCWAGAPDEGELAWAPMRRFGSPIADACAVRPFVDHQAILDRNFPHGMWGYLRSCDVAELNDDVIATSLDYASRLDSQRTAVTIWQLGGAVSRVPADATAFGGRTNGHTFNIFGATETQEGFERERAWVRDYWDALAPHHVGVYVNFLMEEGEERVREAYGADRYDRLKGLKRRYDPDNFFRLNQNIRPD